MSRSICGWHACKPGIISIAGQVGEVAQLPGLASLHSSVVGHSILNLFGPMQMVLVRIDAVLKLYKTTYREVQSAFLLSLLWVGGPALFKASCLETRTATSLVSGLRQPASGCYRASLLVHSAISKIAFSKLFAGKRISPVSHHRSFR